MYSQATAKEDERHLQKPCFSTFTWPSIGVKVKLGITEKRVRALLRKEYPREVKNKQWEITPELVKRIVRDYKAKEKAREAVKKERIKKELQGDIPRATASEDNLTGKVNA